MLLALTLSLTSSALAFAQVAPDEPPAAATKAPASADVTARPATVGEVTARYQELITSRRLDETRLLLHEELHFVDPTADIFGGPLSTGITGRDRVITLQKSWGSQPWTWERSREFVSGRHSVSFGVLTPSGSAPMPFVNILTIENDLIVRRVDYGDYQSFTKTVTAGAADEHLRDVVETADRYVRAYGARDFTSLQTMLAEQVEFQDPTAALLGPGLGLPVQGRQAVLQNLREGLEPLVDFRVDVQDRFYSQNHAVFLTEVSWSHPVPRGDDVAHVPVRAPLIIALGLEDGTIVHHRDYWRAQSLVDAVMSARQG